MITYTPAQRYAILGKSRSGKTRYIILLSCTLVPYGDPDWEIWWLDTKHDPDDIDELIRWGFVDWDSDSPSNRRIITLVGSDQEVYEQAQDISREALARGGVFIVYDEYDHVCKNTVDAGPAVRDVHKRGGGLDVGSAGGVQEPVRVPRYLFSQANHLAIFSLTHLRDIKIARELNPRYAPGWPEVPDTVPHDHGFWLKWLEGHGRDGTWAYWRHIAEWDRNVNGGVSSRRRLDGLATGAAPAAR